MFKYNFLDSEWSELRKLGLIKFSFQYGVLRWGDFMFIVMTSFNYFFLNIGEKSFTLFLIRHGFIWFVLGFIYGLAIFFSRDKQFRQSHNLK